MFQVRRPGASLRSTRASGARLFETLEARQLMSAAPTQSAFPASPLWAALTVDTTRPSVTTTDPAPNSTNVPRNAAITAFVNLPNVGHGVKESLLNTGVVKLYKASDASKTRIAANVNGTAGGDAINLTPEKLLDANTKYVFEVTSGLTDTSGKAFNPFTMSFTTGTLGVPSASPFAFNKASLPTATGHRFTGVTIGPDGRLYAGTMTGSILRWDIKSDGTLGSATTINTVKNGNGGQNRIVIGIHFDPSSTAGNLILWVTHGHGSEEGAPNWTGKLSRLSGSSLGTYQDYVVGLPRSVRDHLTNSIEFDNQNRLYISQGSQNAMGAPDNAWGLRNEQLLSAAILRVDYNAIAARIAAGQGPLNVKTADGGTYSPYAPGAAVTLYATGVRNAYDLLWHSNGNLYAPTNGSAPGGSTPAGGGAPGLKNIAYNEPDWLFKIRKDKYYGHPNPTRQEYVLNGGNPFSGTDKYEVPQYPVGTQPDSNWDPAIYSFGANKSPNGIIEYQSSAFGGQLKGAMLVARYSGNDDLLILRPDAGGNIPAGGVFTSVTGLTGFKDPLDIAEHVGPGNLYVIEYGGQKITLLRPQGGGGSPGGTPNGDPGPVREANTVYFNDPVGGAGVQRKLTIKNNGSSAITITQLAVGGTDPSMFRVVGATGLPRSLGAGQSFEVTVEFSPPSGSALGLRKAELVATTSGGSQLKYTLRALATAGETGANEPGLQRLLELYQRPIKVGDANPATSDMPLPLASGHEAVDIQKLVKAGSGNVTIEPLAVFASAGTPTIKFGYYNPSTNATTQVATFTDSQSVNPGLTSGSLSFDPGSGEFGLYTNAPAFGSRLAYSQDSKNTWEPVTSARKKMQLYPLKDKDGRVVANAYVMAWEEVSGSYDFQDFVAVIRNVRDPSAPQQPPPGNNPDPGAIADLTLYNAVDDVAYGSLANGDTVSHVQRNTWGFTIKAETSGTIGSVRWIMDGNVVATENFAPYAIGGDDSGNLKPFAFSKGAHTVTAVAYSGQNGTGSQLGTITRSFTVADTPGTSAPTQPNQPGPGIKGLTLMNAVDDVAYGALNDGAVISYKSLNTWGLTVRADVTSDVASVRWALDGSIVSTESFAPFAIGGDVNGSDLQPYKFTQGTHVLTVTAFAGRGGTGAVLNAINVTFEVLDQPL